MDNISDNIISKVLINNNDSSFSILTFIDFDIILSRKFILFYLNSILNNNPLLKKKFDIINNKVILKDIHNFSLNNCLEIIQSRYKQFNDSIFYILNKPFTDYNFFMLVSIDYHIKKTRIFFKIHHAYCDGYKLIHMLTSPLLIKKNINQYPSFKRKTNSFFHSIFYFFIGTIILIFTHLFFIFKSLFFTNNNNFFQNIQSQPLLQTDFIICKKISLENIKLHIKNKNITINDFLYSLMIKTDLLYNFERDLHIISPLNVSTNHLTNNFFPIYNHIHNNYSDNTTLLQTIHSKFDYFKFSLFIPFINIILNSNFLHLFDTNLLTSFYTKIIDNTHYTYSNVIGPDIHNLYVKPSNFSFLTNVKNNEIMFNIISCNNNINIICSFKKGNIKDKKLFKKCVYKAYKHLIQHE